LDLRWVSGRINLNKAKIIPKIESFVTIYQCCEQNEKETHILQKQVVLEEKKKKKRRKKKNN